MAKEHRVKIFKSGNSLALRLPKSLGMEEGDEVVLSTHDDGSFSLWKEKDSLNLLMSLYGSMSPGFMRNGRGDIDQSDRPWDIDPVSSAV